MSVSPELFGGPAESAGPDHPANSLVSSTYWVAVLAALRVVLDEGESRLDELGRFVGGHRQVAGGADSLFL